MDIAVVSAAPAGLTTQRKFKDTWHAALAAQYRYSGPWLLSGGIAYDSSMVDDADRAVTLPTGATWAFGLNAVKS